MASRESLHQSRQDVRRVDRPSRTLSQFLLSCRTPSRQAIRKLLFCHFLRDEKHNTYLSEEVVIKVVLLLVCLRRHEVRVQLVSQVVALVGRWSRNMLTILKMLTRLTRREDVKEKRRKWKEQEGKKSWGFLLLEE